MAHGGGKIAAVESGHAVGGHRVAGAAAQVAGRRRHHGAGRAGHRVGRRAGRLFGRVQVGLLLRLADVLLVADALVAEPVRHLSTSTSSSSNGTNTSDNGGETIGRSAVARKPT